MDVLDVLLEIAGAGAGLVADAALHAAVPLLHDVRTEVQRRP